MIQQAPNEITVIQTLFTMSGITKEKVQEQLKEIVEESARPILLFWEIEDIVRATTFKKSFLEENILCDPRVKRYQRQFGPRGKRVWLAEPTANAIQEIIMNEWK
ncbi:hypothetical protein QUF56_09210 [Ureibacillus composti]|nr:hypothetical protein [Ureibacillus composti]